MMDGKVPLRTLIIGGSFALAVLGIIAASYLLVSARVHQESARISDEAAHSIRAAEELQQNLRAHGRLDYNQTGAGGEGYDDRRLEIERAIAHSYGEIEAHIDSPAEGTLVATVERRIQRYLEQHTTELAAGVAPAESYRRNSTAIRAIEQSLEELSRINVDQADEMAKVIVTRANRGQMLGIASAGGLLLLLVVLLLGLDTHLYRPLIRISEVMEAFAAGKGGVRAPRARTAEIDRIATTFNGMAETIELQKTAQLRFLAAIAHDLRTPLGAIRMSADLLKETASVAPDDQPLLDVVVRQVVHLDRLVGDLLETMRTEAGGLSIRREAADLRAIVADAILLHQQSSSLHRFQLEAPEGPFPCDCDPTRIGQVMNNLISNAIKYSPHGGRVRVEISADDGAAVVRVSDQGLGIAAAEIDSVFEPFRRSGATRDSIPGVGLGLSVSRKIIEAHGGTIVVTSRVGGGSTFTVRLPAAANVAGAVTLAVSKQASAGPLAGNAGSVSALH